MGSTYHAIREAVERLGREDVAFLHLKAGLSTAPDHPPFTREGEADHLHREQRTGQLSQLVRLQTGCKTDHQILNSTASLSPLRSWRLTQIDGDVGGREMETTRFDMTDADIACAPGAGILRSSPTQAGSDGTRPPARKVGVVSGIGQAAKAPITTVSRLQWPSRTSFPWPPPSKRPTRS